MRWSRHDHTISSTLSRLFGKWKLIDTDIKYDFLISPTLSSPLAKVKVWLYGDGNMHFKEISIWKRKLLPYLKQGKKLLL